MRARTLIVVALVWTSLGQATTPLPRLPLETYPPAMREPIARAYRDAEARPADAAATGSLAVLLHAWEQWDAAHEAYLRAASLAPTTFEWRYLDACLLERLARPADAAARLRDALKIRPEYLPARVKLADALLNGGAIDESRAMFMALVREPQAEPEALFGLGRIAAAEGKHEEAVRKIRQAISLFPEWGSAYYALALSLRALGRRDDAQQALTRQAQYGPRWPAVEDPVLAALASVRSDSATRLRRGTKLAEAGDLTGAIGEYEAVLAEDKSSAIAHADLVKLYGRTGNWEKADQHYRAALALGSNLAELNYDYGVLLGMQGKWDDAANAYRRALAVNPSYPEAHNNLGQILERSREFVAALDEYRRAIDSRPTFRLARFNAGRMLIGLNRGGEAIPVLEPLVDPADGESARYVFALSVAYIRSGNKDSGIKWGTEARRRAAESGQQELAAAIDRELAAIK